MNIAAIIVGIDGWEKYTLPLIESLNSHHEFPAIATVDNASETPYPQDRWACLPSAAKNYRFRTDRRLSYSAAINFGKKAIDANWGNFGWYIVLSNDVLCTGPFAHILAQYTNGDLVGPCLKQVHGFDYLEGWAVFVPRDSWQPWDERFLGSDYEDVAYSTAARQRGYGLQYDSNLPFKHLDQRQRFHVVEDFAGKNAHNRDLFLREYARVTA